MQHTKMCLEFNTTHCHKRCKSFLVRAEMTHILKYLADITY